MSLSGLNVYSSFLFLFSSSDQALAMALKSDIPAMVSSLLNMGLQVSVNLEDLTKEESIAS